MKITNRYLLMHGTICVNLKGTVHYRYLTEYIHKEIFINRTYLLTRHGYFFIYNQQ